MDDTQDIIDFAEELLDEEIGSDLALSLSENAKNIIEGARNWQMLIKEDSSQTFGSGEDYLTSKDLPDDFFMDDEIYLGVETDDDYVPLDPVPFKQRRRYSESGKYSIDYANKKIYICDKVAKTYTIYLYYIYETPELALDTAPVWPKKYWRLISFLMAEFYKTGIDYDDINVNTALAHNKQALLLWSDMISWDNKLANKAIGGRAGFRGDKGGAVTDKVDLSQFR